MGVPGLTTYVRDPKHSQNWHKTIELSKISNLVIDFDAFAINFYLGYPDLDTRHGNDCFTYGARFRQFITALRSHNVEPVFIRDGLPLAEKLKTIVSRYETKQAEIYDTLKPGKNGSAKRVMIYDNQSRVLFSILRSMNVEFKVGRGDADALIAKTANELGAPILSKDSDYYIFDLVSPAVYLDFQDFPRLKNLMKTDEQICVRCFDQKMFLNYHKLNPHGTVWKNAQNPPH